MTRAKTDKWYAKGLQFSCTSCGLCCKGPDPGWVIVDEVDILRLLEVTGLETKAFGRKYLRQVTVDGKRVLSLVEKRNHDCVFWEDDSGCQVYRTRPRQCRQFPFWPENLETPEAWQELKQFCHGIDQGRLYPLSEIRSILHGRATGG